MSDPVAPHPTPVLSLVARRPPVADPWTPITCLEEFLEKIRTGTVRPENLLIFYGEATDAGGICPHYWSTRMSPSEVIAFAEYAKLMAMNDWRGRAVHE